jgi:hypothetical protein
VVTREDSVAKVAAVTSKDKGPEVVTRENGRNNRAGVIKVGTREDRRTRVVTAVPSRYRDQVAITTVPPRDKNREAATTADRRVDRA